MAVTAQNIAVALGQAAPQSGSVTEQQWNMWIEDAVMLIEARRAELPAKPIDEAKRDYVVRQAVVAHIKKPDDATQVTISADDASSSRTYQSSKGRVEIIDDWWKLLGLELVTGSGAFSLDMVGTASPHLPWCSLHFGATYCSCGVNIAGTPIYEGADEW
jgi:hypothetical protein